MLKKKSMDTTFVPQLLAQFQCMQVIGELSFFT